MKSNIKLIALIAISFMVVFSSCKKKGNEPTPEEEKLEEISGTWAIVGANVLDTDITGVTINFNADNKTYSVTGLATFTDSNLNHAEILDSSGSFDLNDNLDVITLTPGGELSIGNVNKETGDLTLSYSGPFPKATDNETSITLTLVLQ
ncbi:hypothetical protein QYS48_12975 [Marivirga arenosa]|uniref:Lipocalin-like domain-containing protein n=1 Tax=Marivirga arenosa TaxID=3059076 RepID=A0AA49JAM6_9BACT|nr:hypothetical protein [Marivirga sp. ABR2-2]WKK87538.1 hypothetical protein QYS48_12975 [Marivirga sp. ABR2-2]